MISLLCILNIKIPIKDYIVSFIGALIAIKQRSFKKESRHELPALR